MASGVAIPITIQVFKGSTLLKTEKLNQETIKIGKLSSSHLQLEDESVSRMHAVIEVSPTKEVSVVDLGSTKGTFVNGAKITKHKLSSGDEVRIGDVRLVVVFESALPASRKRPRNSSPSRRCRPTLASLPVFEAPKRIAPPPPMAASVRAAGDAVTVRRPGAPTAGCCGAPPRRRLPDSTGLRPQGLRPRGPAARRRASRSPRRRPRGRGLGPV